MWSSTTRFALVDEAEAAELAAEMERDRADARRGTGAEPEPRKVELSWWRDIDKIRYEPPGEVTPRMAEGRIMRAVSMCGERDGLTIKIRSFGTLLAELAARAEQQPYATSDYVPRLQPLPSDHQDFEVAMGWFVALNPRGNPTISSKADWSFSRAQDILLYRARNIPPSYDDIGTWWRISGEAARKTFQRSIRAVTRVANGLPAWPVQPTVDQIEALRERNRAWKRKSHDPSAIQASALEAFAKRGAA